jgi:hypothetical protein
METPMTITPDDEARALRHLRDLAEREEAYERRADPTYLSPLRQLSARIAARITLRDRV